MHETITQSSYTKVSYYEVQQTLPPPSFPILDHTHFTYPIPQPASVTSVTVDPSAPNYGPYPVSYTGPSGSSYGSYPVTHEVINPPPPSNWVVKEAGPVKYSPAIQPLTNEAAAPISQNIPLSCGWVGQSSSAKVAKRKLQRPKVTLKQINASQSVFCNLCKIECCTVEQYQTHLSGKKHNKFIKKIHVASTIPSASQASQSSSRGADVLGGQSVAGIPSVPTDLEAKRQKLLEVGAAVHSVRLCTICNVACNGDIAFADHLAGKKHLTQERAAGMRINVNPNLNPNPVGATCTETNSIKKIYGKTNIVGQASQAWCEICKISCTSNEGLQVHRLGKKHTKNLEVLRSSISGTHAIASTTTNNAEPTKGSEPESGLVKKAGTRLMEPNDLETKKRRVLESGAAAHAVKMCTACNVVCNSEEVFRFHLAGQKHALNVKKGNAGAAKSN